jgi:FtsH-binding integral membrane protein
MNKDLEGTLEGSARAGFVRKVYTLLTLQLLVTIGIGFWAYNSPLFQKIFVNIPAIIILSVLLMAMSCFIACATEAFRKFALPIFILFTIVFSLLIGISICGYKSKIILMAAGLTFLLVAALTIFACKYFA